MSVEEPLGIQCFYGIIVKIFEGLLQSFKTEFIRKTYDKAKAICRTLENDDEEYDLIEKINKKMMGRGSDEA